MRSWLTAAIPALVVASGSARAQDAPQLVSLVPAAFSADIDSKTTTELVITFDRDMSTSGFSLCGGGPGFPKFDGRPQWKNARTLVVAVTLEPEHSYMLSLNCPAARNFRSATGAPLAPVPWSFDTLPAKLPDPGLHGRRNQKAFDQLVEAIDSRYSHQDLRVHDWKKLWHDARDGLLGAPTDLAFASRAAQALAPTEDLHLYLRCGDRTFGTGQRAVDPLFRYALIAKAIETKPIGKNAACGRTGDGIGYLMIGAWSKEIDFDAVEVALDSLLDAKAMVIDVRPNSGGDELLAQRIAGWFVEGRKIYAKDRFREKPGKNGFGKVLERSVEGNQDQKQHFHGPVAVLSGRYVMSSNESFVLMMKQAPACTVVGQTTFGSSGNPKPVELGNGVTVFVPTWQDLLPDGTCFEGKGIPPDIEVAVTSDDLESRDPILERALEVLRAKLAK